ncbi:hypothetical protein Tco_1398669, partial [Tanacetum coccineum]
GEGHMARQCTQPKRPKNSEWFKEKMLLAQAQESGVVLDKEQHALLTDQGDRVDSGPDTQTLPTTDIFQTYDLDTFESDCDEATISKCNRYSEHTSFVNTSDIKITSDNNIISYDQYMKENESEVIQGTISPEQQNAMIMSVIDELSNQVAKYNAANQENKIMNESLTAELERYKEHVKNFEERHKFDLNDCENILIHKCEV